MEVVGLGFYFEDLPVGRRFRTIGRTVTEADITNFVNCTGMVEVLFTNTEFLREESDIKQRLAPAALSYCFAEGLLVQATMQHTGFAFLHMDFNVEKPVFAGDTIHVECEVIEARLSRNRPGRGLVRTRNQVVKQDGTVALTYTPLRMIKCRGADRPDHRSRSFGSSTSRSASPNRLTPNTVSAIARPGRSRSMVRWTRTPRRRPAASVPRPASAPARPVRGRTAMPRPGSPGRRTR